MAKKASASITVTRPSAGAGALSAANAARPAPSKAEGDTKVTPRGVPLRGYEWAELEAIAQSHDATLSSLLSLAVRRFILERRSDRSTLPTRTQRKSRQFVQPDMTTS